MISEDKKLLPQVLSCISDEMHQHDLQIEDEEEDFLDESRNIFYFNLIYIDF